MMREISKMMGVSYKLGGEETHHGGLTVPRYNDACIQKLHRKALPRSSGEQFKLGIPVTYEDQKFGNLRLL